MAQCCNDLLCNQSLAADGALLALGQTGVFTVGGNGRQNFVGVAQCCNDLLCNQSLAADGALLALGQTGVFTVGGNGRQDFLGVAQCCNQRLTTNGTSLRIVTGGCCAGSVAQCCNQGLTTDGTSLGIVTGSCCAGSVAQSGNSSLCSQNLATNAALLTGSQTGVFAVGRNGRKNFLGMAGRRNGFADIVAAGAGGDLHAVNGTGGFGGGFLQHMVAGSSPHTVGVIELAVGHICGLAVGAIGVAQLGRGNGDGNIFQGLVVRTGGLNLVGIGLGAGLQNDLCTLSSGDGCATGSGVHSACGGIQGTLHISKGIVLGALIVGSGVVSATGSVQHRVVLQMMQTNGNPVIFVIEDDEVAAAQRHICAFLNIQLRTGQHAQILGHHNAAAVADPDGQIGGNRQLIFLGVDGGRAQQAQLHGDGQALHFHLAMDINNQAAGFLIIVLDNVTGHHIEHTIGANEGHVGALNAHQSDGHGHVAVLSSAGLQLHGHFDVLDVVMGEGEDAVVIADDLGGVVAAQEVLNLEILVNDGTFLGGHRTGTGDEAPCIELCTVVDGNAGTAVHMDLTQSAIGSTGPGGRAQHTAADIQRAVDHQVGTFRHGQGAEEGGLDGSAGGKLCRLLGVNRVCCVAGNQQGHTAGNGVSACRQRTVVEHSDGLVAGPGSSCHGLVQITVQAVAVDQEPGIALGEHRLHSHVIGRLQGVGRSGGQQNMAIRINPAQEGGAAGRGSHQSRTGTGNIHLAACSHSIAGNGNAAHGAIVLEGDLGGLLNGLDGEAFHHQLVDGGVLCGGDGDGDLLTGLHNLLKAAAGTGILGSINLQLIDRGSGPAKGQLGLAATVVIDIDGSGLGAGAKAENTATALGSHGDGTAGHGVIGSAGDADGNTGNRGVGAGSGCHSHCEHGLPHGQEPCEGLHISIGHHIGRLCLGGCVSHGFDLFDLGNHRLVHRPFLGVNGSADLIFSHISSDAIQQQDGIDPILQFHRLLRGSGDHFGRRFCIRCFGFGFTGDAFVCVVVTVVLCGECRGRHHREDHNHCQQE